MNASATPTAPRSIPAPHLGRAFGGIWRLTFPRLFTMRNVLALAGMLALLGFIAYSVVTSRGGMKDFVGWIIGFYLTFLVPIVVFITAAGAIRDDMKPGTVDYVMTRPVPRRAFVVFKYLSHVAGAQLQFLLAATVLVVIGVVKSASGLLDAIPEVLFAQGMVIFAFSAFGFLCGVLTSRYVVLGLVYGAIVEVGISQIPTQLSQLSMTHHVRAMLQPLAAPGSIPGLTGSADPTGQLATFLLLAGFSAVCLALAAFVFQLRELATATDA